MIVFDYENYKQCVNDWVKEQPKNGYGYFSRMAQHLDTNSVAISQTFKGSRELNLDQAAKICGFMGLDTRETDFFLLLVQKARAGSVPLRDVLNRQISELKKNRQSIKNRIEHQQLSETDKSIFYSNWYFVAVWLAATLPNGNSIPEIALRLRIPESVVGNVLQFLTEKSLLVKHLGRYEFGQNVIHVPQESIFVNKHHLNWRMKALQAMDRKDEFNLHYTAPVSLAQDLIPKIHEQLLQLIQSNSQKIAQSPSEEMMCLNIDWFKI